MTRLFKARSAAAAAIADLHGTVHQARGIVAEKARALDTLDLRLSARADADGLVDQGVAEIAERGQYLAKLAARRVAGFGGEQPVFNLAIGDAADALALVVAANPNAYAAAIKAGLDGIYPPDDQGLTEAERDAERTRLEAELIAAELVEEALVREAERSGIVLERRADAHPAAVLAPDAAMPEG